VDGYVLSYRLIDMMEKMKQMEGGKGLSMPGHDMSQMKSHHLMLSVTAPDGSLLSKGKAGYMISGPAESIQKAMAMFMDGGYGADVDLQAQGPYTVKTKIMAGNKQMMDSFSYEVK